MSEMLEVKDVAARFRVKPHVVLSWIWNRQLVAHDVRAAGARRARWKVPAASLASFLEARTPTPATPQPRRRHRLPPAKEFFR